MDIFRLEIRRSENVLLSISLAASIIIWGYTFWKNQRDTDEIPTSRRKQNVYHLVRSPGTPRTRAAFKKRGCSCHLIDSKDACRLNKEKRKVNGSDEEELDTDGSLIPSSMRSTRRVMLNR